MKVLALIVVVFSANAYSAGLASFNNISETYVGGFKIKYMDDVSSTSFSSARIAVDSERNKIFLSSHSHQDAVGEFTIPNVLAEQVSDMEFAEVSQGFVKLHENADLLSTQGLNGVGGMSIIDGELFVQYYQGYDAGGSITHTTLIVEDPTELSSSRIKGFYEMEGAARVVNYISPIPTEWQDELGGDYLAGNGDGMSIVSRLSNGPSLYAFDSTAIQDIPSKISTLAHVDYPLSNALSTSIISVPENVNQVSGYGSNWDAFNLSGKNNLWTESASAWFGFIIPNTRTFAAIGQMGMHQSGGGYKNIQDNGYLCGGPCPNNFDDWSTYYWLYDLQEIVSSDNPWDVLPYEIGGFDNRFITPFKGSVNGLPSGGSWDQENKLLYISYRNGSGNDQYAPHVVGVYDLSAPNIMNPVRPK